MVHSNWLYVLPVNLSCINKFFSSDSCEDLQCMLQTSPTTLILGGHQPKLFEYDLITAKEIRKVQKSYLIIKTNCSILEVKT